MNLLPEVAEKYGMLAAFGVGEYHFNGRVVNLAVVDLAGADKLVSERFPYLELIEVKAQSVKPKAKAATKNVDGPIYLGDIKNV